MAVAQGLTTVATRTILGALDQPGGRADQVAKRLGDAIRRGVLTDGQQLPPEPELAQQMRVATVTLRDALAMLREQGLVVTRRGRGGGTFVRVMTRPGFTEFSLLDLRELGDLRRGVAGVSAALAAERSIADEVDGLRRHLERLRDADTAFHRGACDGQLAVAVAAAAQSARLTREEMALRAEVGELLWLGLDDDDHRELVRRRRSLVDAIDRRRPARARELAEAQVVLETERLIALRLQSYSAVAEQ